MYAYNVRWHTTTQQDAEGDPRDRPRRGEAHPRRDGRGHGAQRTSRAASTSSRRSCARIRSSTSRTPRRCCPATATSPSAPIPQLAHLFGTLPRTPYGVLPRARRHRAVADDGLLRAGLAHRRPPGQHVREHLQARRAAEVGDGGADAARGGARPSPADRARAGAAGPAGVPQEHELHRVRRGLGALRGEPRRRDGLLPGSVLEVRPAHLRDVARRPPRRRHRPALDGLDAPAGDRLLRRERRQDRAGHHGRSRSLHRLAGPGARLQDGAAEDQGAARERRAAARREVRRPRVPRRRAAQGALPLDVLEKRVNDWIASKQQAR